MGFKDIPGPGVLRALLTYEPTTGKMYWRARDVSWFKETKCGKFMRSAEWAMKNWNSKFAGKEAFTHADQKGYKKGAVLSVNCCAHRVAYALFYGSTPDGFIDHINGDTSDNRIENLRVVDQSGNSRNARLYSSNTSGTHGVIWDSSRKRWDVRIGIKGRQTRIGRFKTKEEAIAARKRAESDFGFHPNHGRLAAGG